MLQELQDHKGLQDRRVDRKDQLDRQDRKGHKVSLDLPGRRVPLVLKEFKDLPEHKGLPDYRVPQDPQDRKGSQVLPGQQDHKAYKDL